MREPVSASLRITTAISIAQIGPVNSTAKTCASGTTVMAWNHRFWPAKWARLRTVCSPSRSVRISALRPVAAITAMTITMPTSER